MAALLVAQAGPHLRPSTVHGYRDHINRYLIPSIGRITLADLTGKRLQACFDLLSRQRTRNGTLMAASTVDRVRATLRSALNAAVREGLIPGNPLAQVRLDKPVRPHPVIWTNERVEAWRWDGIRPSTTAPGGKSAHAASRSSTPPTRPGRTGSAGAARGPRFCPARSGSTSLARPSSHRRPQG